MVHVKVVNQLKYTKIRFDILIYFQYSVIDRC